MAAAAAFLAGSRVAAQTRPIQTEEAATAPAGTLVLEVGGDWMGGEPNFVTGLPRDRWAAPVLRLIHSPADSVEIDLEWAGRVGQRNDPTFGSVSDWGDVALRAKVRFVEEREGRPGLSARFGVTLPETSFGNGLGPNALRMTAQMLLSKSWGALAVHANAGLGLADEVYRPHEQRDFLAYALAVVRTFGGAAVVAEVAGLAGKGMPGADAHSEARLGLRLGKGRVRGDAAIRRGLAEADGDWGLTAGLSWTIRPR